MNILELIVKEISADAILQNTENLWSHTRTSSFDQYAEAASHITHCLEEYGLNSERLELPADGKTTFGDAVMPLAWNCSEAKLEVVSPTQQTLVTYADTPLSVGMWTPPTPEDGVEAELIVLQGGGTSELDHLDVEGKFVLTSEPAHKLRDAAARNQVAGLISYHLPNPDGTDEIQWVGQNTNTPGGWGTKANEPQLSIFSISPKAGKDLKNMADNNAVRLKMNVKSELSTETIPLISATIPGKNQDEEVWLVTPIYGPGAHFNAVTTASILEITRILQHLINTKKFNPPMRTIRFLIVPKRYGLLALTELKKDWYEKSIFCLNLEGGAGNPDNAWCRWAYRTPPAFLRHYADGLAWQIFNQYLQEFRPQRFLESRAFSLASDTFLLDPQIGITTHWLYGGTEQECRHNSLDTPGTIDRRSCIDFTAACCTMMLSMANVSQHDIPDLAYWNYLLAQERLNDDIQVFLNTAKETVTIEAMSDLLGEAHVNIPLRVKLETQVMESLATLSNGDTTTPEWTTVQELKSMLKELGDSGFTLLKQYLIQRCEQLGLRSMSLEVPPVPERDTRVPHRTDKAKGIITLETLPAEQWTSPVKDSPKQNLPFILSWWLIDGKRSIGEIERLLSFELYRYRECIPAWFNFLEKHGYVTFEVKADSEQSDNKTEAIQKEM